MKILSGISVVALLLAGATAPSFATSLPNGGSVVPTSAAFGTFNALASTGPMSYSYGGGADTGVFVTEVGTYSGNPFGANDMTFVYQVEVSTGDIQHVSGFNFTGFNIDVAQTNSSGEMAALDATFNFGVVEFDFPSADAILPGHLSEILIINTNAPLFTTGTVGLIDGGGTTVPGFAPALAPEPSTLSLLGTGLLAVGAGLRRRMRRA